MQEKGYKEIYPFASWKLFTVPSGGENSVDRYKLYGIKNGDTIRILNKTTASYEANDEEGIVNLYGGKIEMNDNKEENMKKLFVFVKNIRPEFEEYLLYKESYNPKDIGKERTKIHKKLITVL
ncbi:hypothetical protein CIN01S_16_00100 [Chryseobacterium indologenes NBRC 14944]|nr:hypothetical protein CIN01S_16_00100 [Chryseobacterium indologenes NBRC 14944]